MEVEMKERRYRSREEWFAIFSEYDSSNQTPDMFCRDRELSLGTFKNKLADRRRDKESKATVCSESSTSKIDFLPLEIRSLQQVPVTEYEVRCPNGRSLIARGAVDQATVREILIVIEGV
jgi:hypothetical protein